MTLQKRPVTVETAADVIFQQWRIGQNATVESVMKTLGTTHRQKVNDLMSAARLNAGEMIQTREAESQLSEDFPAAAFTAIRSWAEHVAHTRLNEQQQVLTERETAFDAEKEAAESERETLVKSNLQLTTQLSAVRSQISDMTQKNDAAQVSNEAQQQGLQDALNLARTQQAEAEGRLSATTEALNRIQTDQTTLRQQVQTRDVQLQTLGDDNLSLQQQVAQLTQHADDTKARLLATERTLQSKEADWLSERDRLIRDTEAAAQKILHLSDQNNVMNEQYQLGHAAQVTFEKVKAELAHKIQHVTGQLDHSNSQLKTVQADQVQQQLQLVKLERENAVLQVELSRLGPADLSD